MMNPLVEMQKLGQSPWHDNIRRELLTGGALKRMVDDGDITGLTSNPTIFEQAIGSGHDYDAQVRDLARQGKSPDEIFDALAIKDISDAADVFAPVYRRTGGADGFVSIEVAPRYANDTARTIDEAHRLWDTVRKPNLMVKIPATAAGVPAIEQCIADGLNINITLIFSLDRYEAVMDAYLSGLERRVAAGKPIDRISSVASFFVSRVDTEVDKRLDAMLATAAPDQAEQLKPLKGKSAIANAKLAYVRFRKTFATPRYVALAGRGARLQRPLWASTSTKNPVYPDLYYVEALIAPDTVDTMPPATIVAYKDHGHPEVRIDRDLDGAVALMKRYADAGVDMDDVTTKLEVDGVASFAKSYDSLIATVTTAARQMTGDGAARAAAPASTPAPARRPASRAGAARPTTSARKSAASMPKRKAAPKRAAKKKPVAAKRVAKKRPVAAKRRAKAKSTTRKRARKTTARATPRRRAATPKRAARRKGAARRKRTTTARPRAAKARARTAKKTSGTRRRRTR